MVCRASLPQLSGATQGRAGGSCADNTRAGADGPGGLRWGSLALGRPGGALGMGRAGASLCPWGHERPRVGSRSDGVREENVIQ